MIDTSLLTGDTDLVASHPPLPASEAPPTPHQAGSSPADAAMPVAIRSGSELLVSRQALSAPTVAENPSVVEDLAEPAQHSGDIADTDIPDIDISGTHVPDTDVPDTDDARNDRHHDAFAVAPLVGHTDPLVTPSAASPTTQVDRASTHAQASVSAASHAARQSGPELVVSRQAIPHPPPTSDNEGTSAGTPPDASSYTTPTPPDASSRTGYTSSTKAWPGPSEVPLTGDTGSLTQHLSSQRLPASDEQASTHEADDRAGRAAQSAAVPSLPLHHPAGESHVPTVDVTPRPVTSPELVVSRQTGPIPARPGVTTGFSEATPQPVRPDDGYLPEPVGGSPSDTSPPGPDVPLQAVSPGAVADAGTPLGDVETPVADVEAPLAGESHPRVPPPVDLPMPMPGQGPGTPDGALPVQRLPLAGQAPEAPLAGDAPALTQVQGNAATDAPAGSHPHPWAASGAPRAALHVGAPVADWQAAASTHSTGGPEPRRLVTQRTRSIGHALDQAAQPTPAPLSPLPVLADGVLNPHESPTAAPASAPPRGTRLGIGLPLSSAHAQSSAHGQSSSQGQSSSRGQPSAIPRSVGLPLQRAAGPHPRSSSPTFAPEPAPQPLVVEPPSASFTEVEVQRAWTRAQPSTARRGSLPSGESRAAAPEQLPTHDVGQPSGAGDGADPLAGLPSGRALDELVDRIYEPLTARLKTELWLDRERSGLMVNLRR